ncbi:L-proline trans-4-hydroxylase-like [Babylonia areolata]|uniref:L-proline trans-4-hydroxylase-like n=1 Tax=Babylonia areolata TaxID=304850 RepID=UPI003FD4239C
MANKGYQFQAGSFQVTPEVKADFDTNGYILVRNLLNETELKKLKGILEDSDVIKEYAVDINDGANRKSRLCLWNQPGNDVTGMVARSEKVAGTCEKLLGGEVYHYHTKLMMKEPFTGGRFVWHQDYGYWYGNTCLFPDMMTVFIAMDPCRQDNGCLKILQGSNRCGRIEHKKTGGQMGADLERVDMLKAVCPVVSVEMDPGDALFFHCNLLHTSSQNDGPNRRWAFLCAYNRADNNPVREHVHPLYTKLNKVPDSAIVDCTVDWDVEAKDFFTQEKRDAYWKSRPEPEVDTSQN